MIKLTPYHFQPIFHRFINLYGYVQYVTDCVTFVLSFLCCQCWEPMQLSEESAVKSAEYTFIDQLPQDPNLDANGGGEPRTSLLGFNPGREDTGEMQQVCQYWSHVSRPPRETGSGIQKSNAGENDLGLASVMEEYPAVHSIRKSNENTFRHERRNISTPMKT
ncbi:unnamed protein product [Colias eurytheme]|nr:unnamed protein product [Colias eurytheme]